MRKTKSASRFNAAPEKKKKIISRFDSKHEKNKNYFAFRKCTCKKQKMLHVSIVSIRRRSTSRFDSAHKKNKK